MTRTYPTCHYRLPVMLLIALMGCTPSLAQQHFMAPASTSSAEARVGALPDAPSAAGVVNVTPVAGEQAIVLPKNWRITPGASRSNLPGKVDYYLGSTWSVRVLIESLMIAGVPNLTSPPRQPIAPTGSDPVAEQAYEQAMDGYGDAIKNWLHVNEKTLRYHADRLEVGLATAESRQLISNLVLPLALHQQARYLPAPVNSDFSERMANAAESVVVTRNDAGMLVPNYSKLGGTVAAAFLGKALYANAFKAPELDSTHFVTRYVTYSLLGDLATNVGHELVRAAREPDITMFALHGRATEDSYYPLSIGGKVVYWARSTYAPRNFVSAALIAGLPTIASEPTEPERGFATTYNGYSNYDDGYEHYGTSLLGWKDGLENNIRYRGRRFAGGLSEAESQMFLQNLAVPVLFDLDPRYIPMGAGYTGSQRLGHAFEGVVVGHTDSGRRTVNLPVLVGTVGAAYAAKELYYPQLATPALASNAVLAKTITINFAADAIYNVVGEFLRRRDY